MLIRYYEDYRKENLFMRSADVGTATCIQIGTSQMSAHQILEKHKKIVAEGGKIGYCVGKRCNPTMINKCNLIGEIEYVR